MSFNNGVDVLFSAAIPIRDSYSKLDRIVHLYNKGDQLSCLRTVALVLKLSIINALLSTVLLF